MMPPRELILLIGPTAISNHELARKPLIPAYNVHLQSIAKSPDQTVAELSRFPVARHAAGDSLGFIPVFRQDLAFVGQFEDGQIRLGQLHFALTLGTTNKLEIYRGDNRRAAMHHFQLLCPILHLVGTKSFSRPPAPSFPLKI